ncbi:MAG: hypothetical protein NUV65_06050 [Candidatus Roizmanbacteria bacterium]|nr:hypothetical protein [Candidatus Roizmanbacteria bacterium]
MSEVFHRLKKNNLLSLSILLVLLLLLSIGVNIRFLYSSKAAEPNQVQLVSTTNSYMFLSPVTAQANDTERIRVSVFVLNERGIGVSNQEVTLKTMPEVKIEAIQSVSDNYGRAIFDTYTNSPGSYTITAQVSGHTVGEAVTAIFK